ncbi:MAG: hypothetical protein OXT68_08340 [Chloroflexota bacterium]|nr:hypothetical protein [Chloroflexota bacterium]
MTNSGELLISEDSIIRAVLILVYVPVCALVYWRLMPRLAQTYKRLAGGFLAAQALAIAAALFYRPKSGFEVWLWNLEQEWNIPATLMSTQLALVGGIALLTAWYSKKKPVWEQLYLVSIGLIFPYLALDEYLKLHESGQLAIPYSAMGAIIVIATIVAASLSPRQNMLWRAGLLAGVATGVMGGIVIDKMPPLCGSFLFLPLDGCLQLSFWEESLELLGIWVAMVAMLGHLSEAVPKPKPNLRSLLYFLPAFWIFLLLLDPLVLQLEFRLLARPVDAQFKSGINLRGYRIDREDEAARLWLYTSARSRDYIGRGVRMGYSVHFVDQESGESIASLNEFAHIPQDAWLFGPSYTPLFRDELALPLPPETPVNRAYSIVLSVWREKDQGHLFQPIITSDLELLSETQVLLGELAIPAEADNLATVPLAEFDNGFVLEAVNLPERAQAGETLSVNFAWRSKSDGSEDHVQFLHLGHEETGAWFVYDQPPLGPRLPARLWYSGLADSETWRVPLPPELAPGQYRVFTGIYRARDGERVPASDSTGERWLDARVRLGMLIIE